MRRISVNSTLLDQELLLPFRWLMSFLLVIYCSQIIYYYSIRLFESSLKSFVKPLVWLLVMLETWLGLLNWLKHFFHSFLNSFRWLGKKMVANWQQHSSSCSVSSSSLCLLFLRFNWFLRTWSQLWKVEIDQQPSGGSPYIGFLPILRITSFSLSLSVSPPPPCCQEEI